MLLAAVLSACGPAPTTHPPSAPGCSTPERAVLGTWSHGTSAMELRANGYILRDSLEGTYRWTDPGRIQIDVGGAHEAYTLGVSNVVAMLLVDPDGHGAIWTRLSPAPPTPAVCYDVRGSLVGDWTDGGVVEHFGASGEYRRGAVRGEWTATDAGAIELRVGPYVRRHQVALATPSTLVIVPQALGADDSRDMLEVLPSEARIETRLSGP